MVDEPDRFQAAAGISRRRLAWQGQLHGIAVRRGFGIC